MRIYVTNKIHKTLFLHYRIQIKWDKNSQFSLFVAQSQTLSAIFIILIILVHTIESIQASVEFQ